MVFSHKLVQRYQELKAEVADCLIHLQLRRFCNERRKTYI